MSNDIDRGRSAFIYFHNRSMRYPNYAYSLDQSIAIASGGANKSEIFLDGLGFAIVTSPNVYSENAVKQAMEKLADKSQGRIPKMTYFFSALTKEIDNITFVDAIPTVALETGKTIVSGFQEVGDTLITTGKALNFIFPVVAVSAILFVVYSRTKRLA